VKQKCIDSIQTLRAKLRANGAALKEGLAELGGDLMIKIVEHQRNLRNMARI